MRRHLLFILFLSAALGLAQLPERPLPSRLYNNLSQRYPGLLSDSEAKMLESKLEKFSRETSNQICVVIVDTLNGFEPAQFATELIRAWGVGLKEKNNGVVILIKPGEKAGQRKLFIATGYGLEGAIPDLAIRRILEEQMFPNLKQGLYYEALDKTTNELMKLASGEIKVKDNRRNKHEPSSGVSIGIIAMAVIAMLVFFLRRGTPRRQFTYGRGRSSSWGWGGGPWYGGGGGSWGGGGSSGGDSGGWGGFGGGDAGGGGAGGDW